MDRGGYAGFEIEVRPPGIALVSFNQPERLNGMSSAMKRDLVEALLQAQQDDTVRVVVFTGEGRAFCAAPRRGRAISPPRGLCLSGYLNTW